MSKEYAIESMGMEEFLQEAARYNPNAKVDLIRQAYLFAEKVHAGQRRLCGRDYFMHCKDVAYMLMKLRLDTATICAGLLHDVLEDTNVKKAELEKKFGSEIAYLVGGVTKIRRISIAREEERAENIRKVLFATIKDIRVILIKLADRLHNMRTLKYHPRVSQVEISRETIDVYVPIAYKLGMYRIKSEMEDLCLRFLEPDVYQELKKRVVKTKEEREKEVKAIIRQVGRLLAQREIRASITGRAKNFYGIYRKMVKKGIPFEQIHDLAAIRVITEGTDDCYRILGLVHSAWTPLMSRFDDYIAKPKPNMYQSLHTEVLINGRPVEIQIRTWKMHHLAEEGIAAHWRYKETERDKRFERRIAWLKQILEWRRTSGSATEFLESLKIDLFKDEIYAITPKGDAIPLPERATPVDFAYAVHSDIGDHCLRAKVNSEIVPLDYELKSGDVVEIVTAKNALPSRNWLKFVKTNHARSKIRHKLGITWVEQQASEPEALVDAIVYEKPALLQLSRCCSPRRNDSIIGLRLKDGKVAVHRRSCPNIQELAEARKIALSWKALAREEMQIRAEVVDRAGLVEDLLNTLGRAGVKVASITTKNIRQKLYIILGIKEHKELDDAVKKVKQVENVVDVKVE